jgi:hypothetical protein
MVLENIAAGLQEFQTDQSGAIWISTSYKHTGRVLLLWHIISDAAFHGFLKMVKDPRVEEYFIVTLEEGEMQTDTPTLLERLIRGL